MVQVIKPTFIKNNELSAYNLYLVHVIKKISEIKMGVFLACEFYLKPLKK